MRPRPLHSISMKPHSQLRQVTPFMALPMFGAATPLLALPAIAWHYGAAGWASIAVGQAIGATASVFIELGWGLTGPQEVAGASAAQRIAIFRLSFRARSAVAALFIPVAMVLSAVLVSSHPAAAACAALQMSLSGLTANWYFLGARSAKGIFLTDAVPRLIGTVTGALLLTAGAPLVSMPAAVTAVTLVGIFGARRAIAYKGTDGTWAATESVSSAIRRQLSVMAGRAVSAIYIGLPTVILQMVSPAAVPTFSAAERLTRMGLLVLQGVPNSLQSYVAERDISDRARQHRRAVVLRSQLVLGLASGVVAGLAIPPVTQILFHGAVTVPPATAALAGLVVLFTCASRGTGMVIVNAHRVIWVTASAIVGAIVGVLMLLTVAPRLHASGAMLALAVAEGAVLAVQLGPVLRSQLRRSRAADGGALLPEHGE